MWKTTAPLVALAVVAAAACGGKLASVEGSSSGGGGAASSSGAPADDGPRGEGRPGRGPRPGDDDDDDRDEDRPGPGGPRCKVSFKAQVLPELASSCAAAGCHLGPNAVNLPEIEPVDPAATWASLVSFVMSNGQIYVNTASTSPKSSGIRCNLRGACGVAMPIGRSVDERTLDLIDAWLACGAPFN